MADLKAIIFDVDGTLAENERYGHRVAFNQAFKAAGLTWHWSPELYSELLQVAGGKERIRFFVERYAPPMPAIDNWDTFVATLHQAKTQHYAALLASGQIGLRPGVKRLITAARQAHIRLAIATTSRLENVLTLLTQTLATDAPQWFEVIAAGDVVPQKKPAADIYHYVLDQLALDAHYCLAIEDTAHGLTAATQAGLTSVIAVTDYTRTQNFAAAACVLTHLGDPDNPCQVLSGPTLTQGYFDLAIAESLLPDQPPA
ncbi:MAG: HAD-IA family hydrolase [Cyanobacteria bacterium P01_E01_bin.43]